MNVKILTEQHFAFVHLKEAAQARLSLHVSKCHIVGNYMSLLIYIKEKTCGSHENEICIEKYWRITIRP